MRSCVCICIALTASGATIHYDTLPSALIERRLSSFRDTNIDLERTLRDLFTEAGCVDLKLTEQAVKHSKTPNLICILEGKLESAIIAGGHFDFIDKGKGVVDNWSGAALLPSLFQSLKSVPRRHRFIFIGFTDEEKGLVGSSYYVNQLTKDDLLHISGMVNLDSLGAGTTNMEMDRGDKRLVGALSTVAAAFKLPLSVVNVHLVGRSDSDSFQDKKVPTILIHSITNETLPILHSPRDQMAAIHIPEYYDSYRLIAAYLAYLDEVLDPAP